MSVTVDHRPLAAENLGLKTLGQVLHRPVLLKIPTPALKLAFGKMATETILASQTVIPARLQSSHYTFQHPTLKEALTHLLTTNN